MIRPNEITYFVFDDIDKWLSKDGYQEIEIAENKNFIFVKANKSYDGHLFGVDVKYDDATKVAHISVQCLTQVTKDKRIFCLKFLNYIAYFEEAGKYILCPYDHTIICSTSHSLYKCQVSIGQLIENQTSCSIENLSMTYQSLDNDDVKISGIHPIRFLNDFLK